MEVLTLVLLALAAVVFLYSRWNSGEKCTIPGPRGVPILGYLPFMGRKPEGTLLQLKKTYGDIVQVHLGRQRVIVLNSLPVIKEALNKTEISDRPHTHSFHTIQRQNEKLGYSGIAFFSQSPKWAYLRRTAVRALSNLVVSPQNRLEAYTKDALDYLYGHIEAMHGRGSIRRSVFNAINSVVGSMNFSTNLPPDHKTLDALYDTQEEFGDFIATNAIADFLPIIRPLAMRKAALIEKTFAEVNGTMGRLIRQHNFDPEIRDVQDALEAVMRGQGEDEGWQKAGFRSMTDVKMVAQDLFAAGTFTTNEHFHFFVRLIALHPEVAEKMRAELEELKPINDGDLWIGLGLKEHAPYCRAVEEEVFRFTSQLPLSISHWTTAEVTVAGYRIPKDTLVMPNMWGLHHDPNIWDRPEEFRPERFVKADGSFDDAAARNVIPFSYGKRRCIGELMARRELFLLYANFVRVYRVAPLSFHGKKPFDASPGFTRILRDADFAFHKI